MTDRVDLLTPCGRLVQGSLYEPQTTDAEGNPLIYKTGPKTGQPRENYYFGLAIAKQGEQHWSQTEWGALIHRAGHEAFPNGQAQHPSFAWKITNGDDPIPNKAGKPPVSKPGFAGNWILNFSSTIAPTIVNETGQKVLIEKDYAKLGDYVQVAGHIVSNESMQQPGIHLNHRFVAFRAYGERINVGVDPKSLGFGSAPLPPGASVSPLSQPIPAVAPVYTPPVPAYVTQPSSPPPLPHPAILNVTPPPPPAAAPQKVMTAKAAGATYQQMIDLGWTDESLVQYGMMEIK